MLLPKKYFVTKGKGLSNVSPLMAFNNALREAGIHQLNLVPVSSILPPEVEEESPRRLPAGSIAFVVMSEKRAKGPARISTGISWARGKPHGYVIEFHDGNSSAETSSNLSAMWSEIRLRDVLELEEPRYLVEELEIPPGYYGSVVVALVFSDYSFL
ncbi:pyruvoyl-dependent arginine decarboxylase [Thermofilum pendens]|uniref:arginine decarboxylase n=1 Tax=Thermofilum pendens (strain DSM 2475 / Hrk 5) TaxID=368408 RepID=A1RYJ3_THEPD|nr:pyruvoyl-dependent arginine decarboxylase [Thermofilum pendens]ABL78273.1 arginine decarboxylase [Thermofilum pendens Hrk 5]